METTLAPRLGDGRNPRADGRIRRGARSRAIATRARAVDRSSSHLVVGRRSGVEDALVHRAVRELRRGKRGGRGRESSSASARGERAREDSFHSFARRRRSDRIAGADASGRAPRLRLGTRRGLATRTRGARARGRASTRPWRPRRGRATALLRARRRTDDPIDRRSVYGSLVRARNGEIARRERGHRARVRRVDGRRARVEKRPYAPLSRDARSRARGTDGGREARPHTPHVTLLFNICVCVCLTVDCTQLKSLPFFTSLPYPIVILTIVSSKLAI